MKEKITINIGIYDVEIMDLLRDLFEEQFGGIPEDDVTGEMLLRNALACLYNDRSRRKKELIERLADLPPEPKRERPKRWWAFWRC